jgi:GNAT superfamily N-acetyltransferase
VRIDPQALDLLPTKEGDFEALAELRIAAMRESLERIGRFDAARARARLLDGFSPADTRQIFVAAKRAGFVVVRRAHAGHRLEHLYIHPDAQGRGIGSATLRKVFEEADAAGQPLAVSALKESDSNRFYVRHGFVKVGESEWDIHYVRPPVRPT